MFLAGIDRRETVHACLASVVILHYFMLCTMFWMAVYAHVLYKSFIEVSLKSLATPSCYDIQGELLHCHHAVKHKAQKFALSSTSMDGFHVIF